MIEPESFKNYLLIGSPNAGKSAFFNMLTGHSRAVGNRPGVTVERGVAPIAHKPEIMLEDLPGITYLDAQWQNCSVDYQVTLKRLDQLSDHDVIVNVVDARSLRRQLYLSLQLMELQRPMVIVLKFSDKSGLKDQLAAALQIPVYDEGELFHRNWQHLEARIAPPPHLTQPQNSALESHWQNLSQKFESGLLQRADLAHRPQLQAFWESQEQGSDAESLLAIWRHQWVESQNFAQDARSFVEQTEFLDSLFLNRVWGFPLFLLVMYGVFAATIQLGEVGTQLLQLPIEMLLAPLIESFPANSILATLFQGLYLGITTVLSFVAPLGILYTTLGLLEQSGYMQRAAVVIDRLMQWMKLPGQSFIPFVVGFGCNVPGIMAARTLQNPYDRLQTILMSPFMSCSARLAIFTVFTKAFFTQSQGAYVIFTLYLLGFAIAVLTGLMMRLSLPPTSYSPLVQEIVPYQWPNMTILLKASAHRLKDFVIKAAQMIVPTTLLIHYCVQQGVMLQSDLFWPIARIFEPMGLGAQEWPAILSLLAGLIAKEIVLGTLEGLQKPPVIAGGVSSEPLILGGGSEHKLALLFASPHAAMSYLIFVLLYFPCVSVTSTIAQESRRFWAVFSAVWSTSIAYIAAMLYYQYTAGNQSVSFLLALTLCCGIYLWAITLLLKKKLCDTQQYHPVNFRLKHT